MAKVYFSGLPHWHSTVEIQGRYEKTAFFIHFEMNKNVALNVAFEESLSVKWFICPASFNMKKCRMCSVKVDFHKEQSSGGDG